MDYCIVLNTTSNFEEARKIAHFLAGNNLAACTNIIPGITSVYRWQEAVQEDTEFLLVIKTKKSLFDEVKQAIRENHSYTLPEIIMLPVENGLFEYLKWIDKETK